jgi:hypothetical protein
MTQDQILILLFKTTLIAGAASFAAFIAIYTKLAPWWRDQLGRTIVIKTALLLAAYIPSILSLFFTFNRLSSHIAAWFDVSIFALIAAVMGWRIVVWLKVYRTRKGSQQ